MEEEKKVILVLRKPPHGTMYPAECLRLGVAISSLEPTIIAVDDGVYAYLKEAQKAVYQQHIDFLSEIEIPLFVDKASLEERGLTKNDLIDEAVIIETKEVEEKILEGNLSIVF
jgi:sulfur relay (sulfurtransferase) DsrF/TusC family protein